MPLLHEIQHAFRAAVLEGDAAISQHIVADGIPADDRVRIYRNTAFGALTEALRLAFPAVERLVGSEFFDAAAAAFIVGRPPADACLTRYGGDFPCFLASYPSAAALSYLADVARFEWALNIAANAPDAPALSAADLAAVAPAAHGLVRFIPHPSLSLLRLDFPADAIADAVLAQDDAAMAAIDLSDGPVWLAVHRGPDGAAAKRLTEAEWRLTERLRAGRPLGAAIEDAPTPGPTALLVDHLIKGRFAGFEVAAPEMETLR